MVGIIHETEWRYACLLYTSTLEFGQPEKVEQLAVKCWRDGSNIISPACGLGTKSPLTNIQAIRHGIMEEAANV